MYKENHPFYNLKIRKIRKRNGKRNKKREGNNTCDTFSPDEFFNRFNQMNSIVEMYRYINTFKKKYLKKVIKITCNKEHFNNIDENKYRILVSMLCKFCFNENKSKCLKSEPKHTNYVNVGVTYINSVLDRVNLNRMFNNSYIRVIIENNSNKRMLPFRCVFKSQPPFSKKMFNYNTIIRNTNLSELNSIFNSKCLCIEEKYKEFIDITHKHIITGNLEIISDKIIKNLIKKGTKFVPKHNVSKENIQHWFEEVFSLFLDKIKNKYKLKDFHLNLIKEKLNILKKKIWKSLLYQINIENNRSFRNLNTHNIEYLNFLKKNFVICPLDKANNNYSFICKKFYLITLAKEMGIVSENGELKISRFNQTYEIYNSENELEIINRHKILCLNNKIKVEGTEIVPLIYSLPKLHKNPVKFRFITGAYNSSVKPLSKEMTIIFTFLKQHFIKYINIITSRNKNFIGYWSINNINISDKISKINIKNCKLFSADFTNMFTSLPHNIILRNIKELIKICFRNAGKKYLAYNGHNNIYYTNNNTINKYRYYTEEDLVFFTEYLLKNSFTIFAGIIYKQIEGVPQGSNCSPLLADLTLSVFEYKFCKKLVTQKRYVNIHPFRYMDDILIIHNKNNEYIQNLLSETYENSLQLETTHESDYDCNYLDLNIKIINNKLVTKLYNKTDSFKFYVIRFPHFNSNISIKIKKSIIFTETLRLIRCCTAFNDFVENLVKLITKLVKVDYPVDIIIKNITKCLNRNKYLLYKYDHYDVPHFIPNLLNYNIKYKTQK